MNREIGRRVHRVIGTLATDEEVSAARIVEAVGEMWRSEPVGGTVAASARVRCSSSVAVYFDRFRPQGWRLEGVEVRLEGAVADLVWRGPGSQVLIDEVKSGVANLGDAATTNQLRRLCSGGSARWGRRFAGVRLVPLGSPARSAVVRLRRGGLVEVESPVRPPCR